MKAPLTKHQIEILSLLKSQGLHIEVDRSGVWACDAKGIKTKRIEQPTFNLLCWQGCFEKTAIIRGIHHYSVKA